MENTHSCKLLYHHLNIPKVSRLWTEFSLPEIVNKFWVAENILKLTNVMNIIGNKI